jgi:hypothetical protein
MLVNTRTIALGLAAAAVAVAPAAALAKHGDDDGPPRAGDDNGGLRDTRAAEPGDDNGGLRDTRAAEPGDDNGGLRADARRRDRRVAGRCTGRSTAKLKAKPDDGRLETEFEVDQNRNGVTWKVRLRRDGRLVVSTRARTRPPSGSFSVERRIADPRGRDRITARATSPSGEVCTARLTI